MKKKYKNLAGNSGIAYYEIKNAEIRVWFLGQKSPYVYNHIKPGAAAVAQMKLLAQSGRGLSTYISQHVGKEYYKMGN